MRRSIIFPLCMALGAGVESVHAQSLDVFSTRTAVTPVPSTPLVSGADCLSERSDHALTMADVIVNAVCASPEASKAWAQAKMRVARVGLSAAAFLPTLNASGKAARHRTSVPDLPGGSDQQAALNLTWVLFDFGRRDADLAEARQLLAAANAAQHETLQRVFFTAARTYYQLRDALAAAEATWAAEQSAEESLAQTRARHDAGAGTLSDRLQAQTAFRRAVLDRVDAQGEVQSATGALASVMGRPVTTSVSLSPSEPEVDTDAFSRDVRHLIDIAHQRHPALLAARARRDAARSHIAAVRALDRPTISLTASAYTQRRASAYYDDTQSGTPSNRGNTIGLQITIPLFEGFASGYRIAEARALADEQTSALQKDEWQVALDVWTSYQHLLADTTNLRNTRTLLEDAIKTIDIVRGRYKAGVGTITELLSAQTALADARRQRVLALSRWRTAKLKLASSLGILELADAAHQ